MLLFTLLVLAAICGLGTMLCKKKQKKYSAFL
ncbi:MAG TPA: hypothetical protein DD733_01410 [Clostridiales bacterium]|nr:hypothetical protein [Clostridiales bacterium]